jgi:glycogen debranching enzyme
VQKGCTLICLIGGSLIALAFPAPARPEADSVARFPLVKSGLELEQPAQAGRFFGVVGRRSAVLGHEGQTLESWVYPLKLLDDFHLSFRLRDYPLEIDGREVTAGIAVRPEATVLTYAHAAFTVRQIIFAPLEEPGILMLLDVESTLPMTITASFRPRLRLMWPGGLMTPNLEWDGKAHAYFLTEESKRFAAVVGSPTARDVSVMPYQEEPRDVPTRFVIEAGAEGRSSGFIPIAMAASVEGRAAAIATYGRLLSSVAELYDRNVSHYRDLQDQTVSIATPDARLDESFAWAKVGLDKGMVTNPLLGTGLVAGYRTSGDSERPGYAWFFGRDALWSTLALDACGDFAAARTALAFLKTYQRADGKIPHEVSQSASLLPWFTDYPYPWNSADATPLYVVAHGDYWRATGDREFLKASWESILKAWRFSAGTDTDGNGLVENTRFGHGWVEGGALYPPHEEIYMQGVFMEAARSLAEMAEAMGQSTLAEEARAAAERTRAATERTYWLEGRGFYGFATVLPTGKPPVAEPGPDRERRQARMEALARGRFVDEDTVLPAVPLWWHVLEDGRGQSEIDHLGAGAIATDWGARLLSNRSELYDPLSYHYGSVWPLFTGWTAMAAYGYGRPHVGIQALMANALLRSRSALGYVTELLSGDFDTPFGRSSHHQVWSEAMVVTPILRGLLGLEAGGGGRVLRFAPQLPADWDRVTVRSLAVGESRFELKLLRTSGRETITIRRQDGSGPAPLPRLVVAPSFPLDATVRSVAVNGRSARFARSRSGDVQRAEVVVDGAETTEIVFAYDEGTDVYMRAEAAAPGARSQGLRVLRARAEGSALDLSLEGLGGHTYALFLRTPRRPGAVGGVTLEKAGRDWALRVAFEGPPDRYVRRDVRLPLRDGG